jgi:hypothetical protein
MPKTVTPKGSATSAAALLAQAKANSKRRVFYKKGGVSKTGKSGEKSAESSNAGEKKADAKPKRASRAKKRAKMSFYQNQNEATISWYATRDCIRQHLNYAFQKYPIAGVVEDLNVVNASANKLVGSEAGSVRSYTCREMSDDASEEQAKQVTSVQLSECAVEKIRLFLGKRVERWLSRARLCTLNRKAQTTTVLDFCQGWKDYEDRL